MDADQDLKFAIGWNRLNLRLLGVWPEPLEQKEVNALAKYRVLIPGFFMLGFICGPQSANLLFIWGNAELITENLATANIPVACAFGKMMVTWYHRDALKPLVNVFYCDWRATKTEEERRTMLDHARTARKISIWCTMLTQLMVTVYISLRIVTISRVDRFAANPDRSVPYPAYFPFDVRRSPIFELTCFGQILSAYFATVSYTGIDGFVSMLVLHACGQFSNLRRNLRDLSKSRLRDETRKDSRERIGRIVERHEHLDRFVRTIEESYNLLMLSQILACTVQLCFQGFQVFALMKETNIGQLAFHLVFLALFVTFIIVHLFVYCYIGEMILVESSGLGYSAYESSWYNVPVNEARNLLFVMHRCTRPLRLTAGKFGTFSMEMFSSILRTSLGYLSVLLTVTDHND